MSAVISGQPSGTWHATVSEGATIKTSGPTEFPSWSGLLPSAVLHDHEEQATYVKTRSVHNKNFFDDVRTELTSIMEGLKVQMLVEDTNATRPDPAGVVGTQRSLLQGLYVGKGFLGHREQHKALGILELCVDVADHLTAQIFPAEQLFWQMLSRLVLGDAYSRFRKYEEATTTLQEAITLCESEHVQPGAGERILEGACQKVLCRQHLELALQGADEAEAQRHVEASAALAQQAVELLEKWLPEAGAAKRDAASSLATAYSSRGVCEVRAGRFEACYEWFTKAQETLKDLNLPGSNAERILQEVADQVEHARQLHQFTPEAAAT